jgi:hypothetical protein
VPRISGTIDDTRLVTLTGNTFPLARPEFDEGVAPGSLPMARMLLVLKRSPAQESVLQELINAQHEPGSPRYHQWLTPEEFGAQFGVAQEDIDRIVRWLQSHGFVVAGIPKGRNAIEFSGTNLQVQRTFHTELHRYRINGEAHLANASAPQIPAALAPVIGGVDSLNDFRKKPVAHLTHKLPASGFAPDYNSWPFNYVAPGDFWTIYNATPAITAGATGKGITIGIVGRSDIIASDVSTFRSTYIGGSAYTGTFQQIVNGPDPGDVGGDDLENTLDVEWASALAPDATVTLVVSQSGAADGVDLSAQYLVDSNLADIISVSYGQCESYLGSTDNAFFSDLWAQATAQGTTVVVSTGDNGAAGCDTPDATSDPDNPQVAQYGLQVNGVASSAYNVAIGGTQYYNEASSWSSTMSSNPLFDTSALGYIPEQIWNESCDPDTCGASASLWAGSGGVSNCAATTLSGDVTGCSEGWAKPEWQNSVFGIPNDGARDLPDVSFTAAGHDGYMINFQGEMTSVGGTSCSTPSFAGVMALVDQKTGGRQGQANYVLYELAGNEYGGNSSANSSNLAACNAGSQPGPGNTCTFYDVTTGSNAVPCAANSPNCSATTPGTYGMLSGYSAAPGYDLASGLGSINIANLLQAWDAITPRGTTPTTTLLQLNPTTGIVHGSAVSIHVSVAPRSGSGVPAGTVTVVANGNAIGTLALTSGAYSGVITNLPGGQYAVTARYSGDATFATSTSPGVTVSVGKEDSAITLSVAARDAQTGTPLATSAIPYGSNTILYGSVAGASGQGTPTGSFSFSVGGTGYGTLPLNNGRAGYGFVSFSPGSYSFSGNYAGDGSFNPSVSTSPATFTVVKATPTVSVVAGAAVGGNVPVTATVNGDSYATAPSGTITFFVNGYKEGSAAGTAGATSTSISEETTNFTVTGGMLNYGANSVTAQYGGDGNYNGSAMSSPATIIANKVSLTNLALPEIPVLAQVFKPGLPIPIDATIYGTYQNLSMAWAPGINATSGWSTSGVSISGSITAPIVNEQIGTWTPSGATLANFYTVQISVTDAGITSTATALVYLEPDLLSANWPMWLNKTPGPSNSSFVPATDAAGNVRLLLPTSGDGPSNSELMSFSADGSWHTSVDLSDFSDYQPAAGDLDLAGGDEVVLPDGGAVDVFRPDGTLYTPVPQAPDIDVSLGTQQVLLDDVDGDSLLETVDLGIGLGQDGLSSGTAYVFAWRNNGQLLTGNFPIAVADQNIYESFGNGPRVLVGDINGDGAKEFVVMEGTTGSTVTPLLFAADGSPRTWAAPSFNGFTVQIALADLDHNGQLETILVTEDLDSPPSCHLHVLQPDGSERAGWPQTVAAGGAPTISVGDLNQDGHEEIVLSSFYLYVFHSDGTSFSSAWPTSTSHGPTVLADVNGDGYPEIVTTSNEMIEASLGVSYYLTAQLTILDRNGTTLRSWNLLGANGEQPLFPVYPAVGDFSGNGRTEIAVSYPLQHTGGGWQEITDSVVAVLNTGAPYNATANDWPLLHQNPRNTAVRRSTGSSIVTIRSSANPSTPGQAIIVTITVAPAAPGVGTPTGVANLLDGSQNIGSCRLSSGACTIQPVLTSGVHSLIAGYVGDSHFATGLSAVLNQFAGNGASTTTGLVSSVNPSVASQTLTLTATVAAVAPGNGPPTGNVTFFDGTNNLGSGSLNAGAQATLAVSSLGTGSHSITAAYEGDKTFVTSTAPALTQVVNKDSTTTTLTSSANPSSASQPLTLAATVAAVAPGSGTPTGAVTFFDGTNNIGSGSLNGGGQAALVLASLSAGVHSITATYGGDNDFVTSTAPALIQAVNKPGAILTLSSSVNPSVTGQTIVIGATVAAAASGNGTPTGHVTFFDGTNNIGSGTLDGSGQTSLPLSSLSAGDHSITASYEGDGTFGTSTTVGAMVQTVIPAAVTISGSTAKTVTAGGSAGYTITLAPSPFPFNYPVTGFSCSSLPVGAACTFATASVTPGNNPVFVALSISTTARNLSLIWPSENRRFGAMWASLLGFGWLGIVAAPMGRKRRTGILCIALTLLVLTVASCGGGGNKSTTPLNSGGTPAGTYSIGVNATANGTNYATTVLLTVE